jgi:16S rRNA (cytidine1402-2'-O)-methyltransferase
VPSSGDQTMETQYSLSVIATPIGNLGDLSPRAQEALSSVDYVLAEDTRRARKLKSRFGFAARIVSLHEHNESKRIPKIIELMKTGVSFALISDAGTPLVSDPGFLLIRKVVEEGLSMTQIPGPSAPVSAVILSGLPPYPFLFYGFLPSGEQRRSQILQELTSIRATLVFFESPDRVLGLLREIGNHMGNRDAAVCREMTKLHEEVHRGKISTLISDLSSRKLLGEYTVVIGPPDQTNESVTMTDDTLRARFNQLQKEGYSRKDALKKLSKESGRSRNELYDILLKQESSDD